LPIEPDKIDKIHFVLNLKKKLEIFELIFKFKKWEKMRENSNPIPGYIVRKSFENRFSFVFNNIDKVVE